ncbi:PREDICTED: uncharacterized protein LOC109113913 [Nelumbo nucifera]|uniref:Uncharacterized protein LOC109113913 n=1 Tax=Nelumbo nucifera TaxID=4432 RepID=A0A1U8PXW7_NELNU|nr:PREDICTED: uncharacterized protein LOC109113913 [Nelumbo nucifera]
MGFRASTTDTSLFVYCSKTVTLYLLIYLDDVLLIENSQTASHSCIQELSRHFSLKDLGPIAFFLGCLDDIQSIEGFAIFLGPNLVAWRSRKQATVARSSTESEFRACATTTTVVLWITSLLRDLGVTLSETPTIWCDNIGATYLAANLVFRARTQHVEVDFYFL